MISNVAFFLLQLNEDALVLINSFEIASKAVLKTWTSQERRTL